MRHSRTLILIGLLTLPMSGAVAQAPAGADTLSRKAVAESLKVMDRLAQAVKANPRDAGAWYQQGMVAFALATRASKFDDGARGLDFDKLRILSSESLLNAARLDSTNTQYAAALSRFRATDKRVGTGTSLTCVGDIDSYRDQPDEAIRVNRMLEMAVKCWLDFDGYENRAQSSLVDDGKLRLDAVTAKSIGSPVRAAPASITDASARSIDNAPIGLLMARAIDSVRATLVELPFDVAGELDYMRARALAGEAYRLAPDSLRAYQFLMMLAVARNNWADLEQLSRERVRRDPKDGWASMALALARYRLEPRREMAAAFDSALTKLDARERRRLDRFERIMRPSDIPASARTDSATKAQSAKAMWLLAQPLWSSSAADPRTEFLARVTHAELRWTLPGGSVRGADTDRGDIFIRYGPPNRKLGFQVEPNSGEKIAEHLKGAVMFEFWMYNADLVFAFAKNLHTGRATFSDDPATINAAKQWQPARWDNIATARIDSMATQVVRFRSGDDSIEVFMSTRAPMEALALTGIANDAPTARLWLYGLDSPAAFLDSTKLGASGRTQWTRRVAAGDYYYRLESMIPGTLVAGRASAAMTMGNDPASGFVMRGFGISDLLLATRTANAATARRWIDFDPDPLLGAVQKASEVALVWESYELGQTAGSARYEVAVTIDRVRSRSGRIAAQIVGRAASAVGIDRSDDRLAMKFERVVPYNATIADNLSISLGDTPPGSYLLTLQITDRVSGRVATRTVSLTIAE